MKGLLKALLSCQSAVRKIALLTVCGAAISSCAASKGSTDNPTSVGACPAPIEYSTVLLSRAATMLEKLPASNEMRILIEDYHKTRDALRAVRSAP